MIILKKKILYTGIAVLILITALILILCPKQNSTISYEVFKARADINSYFKAIINEDYSKAVQYVSFFKLDESTVLESSNELDNYWIERISTLADKDIQVIGIDSLDVKTVDGVIHAQISLTINDVGYSDKVTYNLKLTIDENANIFDIKYKIKDVTEEELRIEIEDALSGIVK